MLEFYCQRVFAIDCCCCVDCIQADKQRRKLYASSFYILNIYEFTLINSSRFLYLVLLICYSYYVGFFFLLIQC